MLDFEIVFSTAVISWIVCIGGGWVGGGWMGGGVDGKLKVSIRIQTAVLCASSNGYT